MIEVSEVLSRVRARLNDSNKQKLETPSEWGHNYSEFKGDGLGAINKLLETKKGFVAGAFYKEG
ncbi:hypothetical protein, partial [Helicobacter pylori]|uniref:hypothetical protein n=1 Tax=Helicobacter pylori TaxID=210 RepID=UPI001C62E49E